ncbi:MAG: hypothetical protein JO331_09200 [Verrucomicrobia bacterium]|nr:hypothetical protein [Verrucomicrobiota bacterium]
MATREPLSWSLKQIRKAAKDIELRRRSDVRAVPDDVFCIDDDPWPRQYWGEIMDHPPLEQLVVEGDEVFHQEIPGSSQKKKYLGTPPISVVAKGDTRSIDREAIYSFRLNHAPCPPWRELFKINGLVFPIQFDGDVLTIRCTPSNLEVRYGEVKQAIQKTNSDYTRTRQDLIAEIKAHQFQAAREEQKRLDAERQVQKALDDLQL